MHFYSLDKVISYNIPVNIIITERGYGKSYSVKEYVINKFLKKKESFMYIRRYENVIEKRFVVEDMTIENLIKENKKYMSIINKNVILIDEEYDVDIKL